MRSIRLVLAAAGVVALALIAWLLGPSRPSAAAPRGPKSAAVAVDTALAARRDTPIYMEGLGTMQAFYTVKVTARVDGELTKVDFGEGQKVKRGQLLAQIDPRPYQAALDLAIATRAKDQAQLANARKDLARYMLLEPKHLASQQTVDTQHALVAQLKAQIEADQANIESARTELSYTRITSPIDGRTGIRQIDPGNIVHAADTTPIVVLTQLQPIAAIVTLPETSLGALTAALSRGPVSISVAPRDQTGASGAGSGEEEHGTVELIDNQIDPTTGTVRLKAVFQNARNRLWPGEFVEAHVLVRVLHDVLTIPAAALQRGPNGLYVYVVGADSKVATRALKVGYSDEQVAVVQSGLEAGERVVTSNFYRLQPGVPVRIDQPARSRQPARTAGPAVPPHAGARAAPRNVPGRPT